MIQSWYAYIRFRYFRLPQMKTEEGKKEMKHVTNILFKIAVLLTINTMEILLYVTIAAALAVFGACLVGNTTVRFDPFSINIEKPYTFVAFLVLVAIAVWEAIRNYTK